MSSPTTITKRITSLIIDSIERGFLLAKVFTMRLVTSKHVVTKILKFQPTLTNSNAPATISVVMRIIWIKATGFHVSPSLIKPVCFSFWPHTMSQSSRVNTAATLTPAVSQSITFGDALLSTLADTFPRRVGSAYPSKRYNGQLTKFLSYQIKSLHMPTLTYEGHYVEQR